MKLEIIGYNKFMLGVDRAYHIGMVPYCKCYREHVKWTKGFMLFWYRWLIGIYRWDRSLFSFNKT